jgi:DNA-binding transcriptional LysR family regulator
LLAPDLVTRALPHEPLMLALPESHALARKSRIAVADLAQAPILIAPRAIGPSFYDRTIAYFAGAGISPRIVQQVTPMTTLTGLVAAGVGMGFVTAGIARLARPGVAYRPLTPEPPSLPLAAAWQTLTPSGRQFLDIVLALTGRTGKPRRKQ